MFNYKNVDNFEKHFDALFSSSTTDLIILFNIERNLAKTLGKNIFVLAMYGEHSVIRENVAEQDLAKNVFKPP
jgi:hypothetical protein